jgi:hypothetical protein
MKQLSTVSWRCCGRAGHCGGSTRRDRSRVTDGLGQRALANHLRAHAVELARRMIR